MKARMLISMSSMRSPAAARTIGDLRRRPPSAVIVAIASGPTTPAASVPLMPTMSASRAAIDSTRLPPPPIRIGWARRLHRSRRPGVVGDRVVLARERERLARHRPLDHRETFLEAVDAHLVRVERRCPTARSRWPSSRRRSRSPDGRPTSTSIVASSLAKHDRMLVVVVPHQVRRRAASWSPQRQPSAPAPGANWSPK